MIDITKIRTLGDNVLVKVSKDDISSVQQTKSGISIMARDKRRCITVEVMNSTDTEIPSGSKVVIPIYLLESGSRATLVNESDIYKYYIINKIDIELKIGD